MTRDTVSLELQSESFAADVAAASLNSMPRSESEPTLSQLRRRSSPRRLTCCTSSQSAKQRGLSSPGSANTLNSTKSADAGRGKRQRGAARRTSSALARAQSTRTLRKEPLLYTDEMLSPRTDAFAYFDRDGDGFITAQDLRTGLSLMGHEVTLAEAVEMIGEAGGCEADKDGRVTAENLKSLLEAYGVDC